MRLRDIVRNAACLTLLALVASPSYGQLYTEDFDDGNAVSRWTAHAGIGFEDDGAGGVGAEGIIDTNFDREPFIPPVDGVIDDFSGFAFDYSVHGIPPAPSSSDPNSTTGLQLQANLFSGMLGGFSVSPNSPQPHR